MCIYRILYTFQPGSSGSLCIDQFIARRVQIVKQDRFSNLCHYSIVITEWMSSDAHQDRCSDQCHCSIVVTERMSSGAHLEVGNELGGLLAQAAMVGDVPPRLHQQQVIKGLKNVDAGLVDGAHHGAPGVHSVTHAPHDNGCCSGIQACSCTNGFETA